MAKAKQEEKQLTVEELLAQNEQLQAENETLIKVNEQLTLQIEELSKTDVKSLPAVKKATDYKTASFVLDGVEYGFNFPRITIKKASIGVDEVLASADLQQELVAAKNAMIKAL